jgi:hypothetical protein
MGNAMAALFLSRVSGGASVLRGAIYRRLGMAKGWQAVERKDGGMVWQNSSACFLQSPLCRYFGKESAP